MPPKRSLSEEPIERNKRTRSQSNIPENQQLIPSSDEVIVPEDDEDIPYTHNNSRSTSPLSDISTESGGDIDNDIEITRESTTAGGNNITTGAGNGNARNRVNFASNVEVVDVDDELREYYVISEDDNEEDEDETNNTDKEQSASQRTVQEQLEDTSRQNNSNLHSVHCAVCFDSPEQTYILPCGHVYCGDCAFKALSSTKQSNRTGGPCSLCRAYTPYKKVTVGIFKKKRKVLI